MYPVEIITFAIESLYGQRAEEFCFSKLHAFLVMAVVLISSEYLCAAFAGIPVDVDAVRDKCRYSIRFIPQLVNCFLGLLCLCDRVSNVHIFQGVYTQHDESINILFQFVRELCVYCSRLAVHLQDQQPAVEAARLLAFDDWQLIGAEDQLCKGLERNSIFTFSFGADSILSQYLLQSACIVQGSCFKIGAGVEKLSEKSVGCKAFRISIFCCRVSRVMQ